MLTGYRMKKRTFVVAGLALLASLLVAGMMSLYASSLLGPGVLHRFSLSEQVQHNSLQGSGINVSSAGAGNLISDGSFEPVYYEHFLTAFSGSQDTLAVSSAEASLDGVYSDDFFVGAQARIMSPDPEGLRLKKQAVVRSYILNQPGLFQNIRLPADMPAGFRIHDIALISQDLFIAGGSNGQVLTVDNNEVQALSTTSSLNSIISVAAQENLFAVCSNAGELYITSDGYSWKQVYGPDIDLKSIALNKKGIIVAVGRNGKIVSGTIDNIQPVLSPVTSSNLNKAVEWQDGWLVAGNSGTILYSDDGITWDKINEEDDIDWLDIVADETSALLIGAGGITSILKSENGSLDLEISNDGGPDLITLGEIKQGQLIGLDNNGVFWLSKDDGHSYRKSELNPGIKATDFIYSGNGRIIAIDDQGRLAHSQLVAGISLDSPLQDGQYQAGDLIFLSKISEPDKNQLLPVENGGFWITDKETSVRRINSDNSPAGSGHLEVDTAGQIVLSQNLNKEELRSQLEDNVLRFSGWFRTADTSINISVKIKGLRRDLSTTFDLTPGQWRRHSYSFVIPETWLQDEDVVLVIEVNGSGTAAIDDINLTSAVNAGQAYTDDHIANVNKIAPAVMRLEQVPIGRIDAPADAWLKPVGQTGYVYAHGSWKLQRTAALAPALELASNVKASPWLVIDATASQEDMSALVEYLAAPVSEPYGKLRMEQGRAVPWTEAFTRIYIEIADDSGLFVDDRLKSSYVDWIIDQISSSAYYVEIKNRLVFIDAMEYSQGLMQSSADYHASTLKPARTIFSISDMEHLYADYWSNIPRNTDKLAQDWPEMLRSVSFCTDAANTNTSLAEMVSVLGYDLGSQTGLVLIDMSCAEDDAVMETDRQKINAAAALLSSAAVGKSQNVVRLSASENVFVFAANDSSAKHIIISNTGDMPATCQLVTDYDLTGAAINKYDSTGSLIGTEKMKRNEEHITVLPGGAVCLEKLDSQ